MVVWEAALFIVDNAAFLLKFQKQQKNGAGFNHGTIKNSIFFRPFLFITI